MTKLIFTAILSLTILSCGQNKPEADNNKQRIDKVCDNFMEMFAHEKVSEALQLLKQNSVMEPSSIDTLQKTIQQQANNVFPVYGKILSYEFVSEHKVKNFIARRFYILKFYKYYLKFDFTLYNNGSGWTITNFNYNDELLELLY